jgi:hypothetical protein
VAVVKSELEALAEEMEPERPDWAMRLRAAINVGRPVNKIEKARQKRVRDWMIDQLKNKKRPREEVLSEVVRKHGGNKTFWWNLYKLKGRPPDYFDS